MILTAYNMRGNSVSSYFQIWDAGEHFLSGLPVLMQPIKSVEWNRPGNRKLKTKRPQSNNFSKKEISVDHYFSPILNLAHTDAFLMLFQKTESEARI